MPEKPRLLIEQWLPIAAIGAECMRERGASSALPPLYFLHVWWARRPLTVSRAAILASLLPAYPTGENGGVRPWPQKFLKTFPTFDAYKAWFLQLIGILGDPVQSRRIIEWAKTRGIKITPEIIRSLPKEWRDKLPTDMSISLPYGYARAFTRNPSEDELRTLYDLLEWTWGTREITFCDPMAGGGSIPFEALRYGLTVHANELNPVASVILKATLDYPARFGPDLAADIRKYGEMWCERVRERLEPFYPLADERENIFAYLWARTVACPVTGKPVPLSPNWWLKKGSEPMAARLIADPKSDRCRFEIVRGKAACEKAKPDQGTVKRGTGVSPWTGDPIDGDYIKAEAQAGRMGEQLYAIGIKKAGDFSFRPPTAEDLAAYDRAVKELKKRLPEWEAKGLVPSETVPLGSKTSEPIRYGMSHWSDLFAPRQLLGHLTILSELFATSEHVRKEIKGGQADAIITYLSFAIGKCVNYSSRLAVWHAARSTMANTFSKHDFAFCWSHGEFDASRNLLPWALDQVLDAQKELAKLVYPSSQLALFQAQKGKPVERMRLTRRNAQALTQLPSGFVRHISVDPPYYDNVQYAELSDYFYVWMKRSVGGVHGDLLGSDELVPKDDEAVANPARFEQAGAKKGQLAEQDYENKMMACFKEMNRVLSADGVLTVMFTHKRVEAWDTLGSALLNAGFKIDASWPVHTESEHSLHQAKKNAAASTILLVCRKRDKADEPVWWDDLKGEVRTKAREAAARFEKEGIRGVDLYISTFGPVLAVISEKWPVLTSQTDPKTGDPLPLKPGDALDLARQEVINLRKRGLLLGRAVEFDPVTDWYLMAWDAFRAQEFPADEARRLALALGLDIEADIVRTKRLVSKKSASVVLQPPAARRRRGMVDPEAEAFPHLVDALHTAMLVYDEEGSKACQVFVDRRGFRNDSRLKALVQAMMEAIPTTRDKQGKFVRPEMETLEAMRLLFWSELAPPKEEEEPKIQEQPRLPGTEEPEEEVEDEGEEEDDEAQ
jgi:adenine-specific DNA methylase